MTLKHVFRGATILAFSLAVVSLTWSAEGKGEQRGKLLKPTRNIDVAIGLLDAGKLHNVVHNNGKLADWADNKVPSVSTKGWSYVAELSMIVGVPEGPWTPRKYNPVLGDTVSMGPSVSERNIGSDWGPRDKSLGQLHSGNVTFGKLIPGSDFAAIPVMATSTIPETWPNGVWPGPWARDPKTGQELPGTFTSDKDVFFSVTDFDKDDRGKRYAESDQDTTQGYALGIQVDISAFSYGRSYAEDFIFFPTRIINRSKEIDPRGIGWDYTGVYVGFYIDADLPEYKTGAGTVNDRWDYMSFIKSEYDADLDTTYDYNMAYFYDVRWRDGQYDATRPDKEGDRPQDVDAWKVHVGLKLLETPKGPDGKQLGLTDWHWFNWEQRPGALTKTRQELIQYKVISGDTTGLLPEEQANYFWPDPTGKLDPHFDSPESIRKDFPEGLDCVFIMSSGPFNLAAGDTTTFSFCLIVGDDLEDLKFNARTAQLMYNLNYQGANPPKPPRVTAVPGDGRVTLYWDRSAEESVDIMTGYTDFEGYKIYRTTTPPSNNQWGEEIRDGRGQLVGFVPLAQYDLDNSIKGLDPEYPHLFLGNNTGLKHSYVDSTVKNGVTYWYSVTAYDRGVRRDPVLNPDGWANLNSLESAKGNNPGADPNLVMVVPGVNPPNFVKPTMAVEPLPGTIGNGRFEAAIIDRYAITGHVYEVSFDDTTFAGVLTYNVFDENQNRFVVRNAKEVAGEEGPFFDGLQLTVETFTAIAVWEDSVKWFYERIGRPSDCNWEIGVAPMTLVPADYEVRFTERGDTSTNRIRVPFEVWNVTEGKQVDFLLVPAKTDTTREMQTTWTSGDQISLREKVAGRDRFTWLITLSASPDTVITQIDTTIAGRDTTITDTTIIDIPPKRGDIARVMTQKPFVAGRDRFKIRTERYKLEKPLQAEALKKVRVVPNPYIVSEQWELNPNIKQLAFTNLPSECKIHIFTLTGEKVATLDHKSETQGWEFWNLLTFNRQEIAYGLYIYVVETPDGQKTMGKFAVIK